MTFSSTSGGTVTGGHKPVAIVPHSIPGAKKPIYTHIFQWSNRPYGGRFRRGEHCRILTTEGTQGVLRAIEFESDGFRLVVSVRAIRRAPEYRDSISGIAMTAVAGHATTGRRTRRRN